MADFRTLFAGAAIAGFAALTPITSVAEGAAAIPDAPGNAKPIHRAAAPTPAISVPVRDAVRALEAQYGVAVMDPWGLIDAAEVKTADFSGLAAEAAFRSMLAAYELLFYYPAAGQPGGGRLAEVWVYPPGMVDRGAMGTYGRDDVGGSTGDGASRRAALIENLVLSDPAAAQGVVARGLGDPSETVRARTVAVAASMGIVIANDVLMELLRSDPAEEVRTGALDALAIGAAGDPDSLRALVEQAQQDPSPLVQAKAAELAATYAQTDTIEMESDGTPEAMIIEPQ